jgi:hypothetical protein
LTLTVTVGLPLDAALTLIVVAKPVDWRVATREDPHCATPAR